MLSYCGLDCTKCEMKQSCSGCSETSGKPFSGGVCPIASCCIDNRRASCAECRECTLKNALIAEFNALGIADMPEIKELYALAGTIVNMEYPLPGGTSAKFWDDKEIYFGNQVEKISSERCYGLAANKNYLMVCEYGEGGSDPEIVVFKRR